VVTLVPDDEGECFGAAFELAPAERPKVLARLDHREQGGYERREIEVELVSPEGRGRRQDGVLVYLANSENVNYLGPDSIESIAEQVLGSHGPSGSNGEYVLKLAESVRGLGGGDEHLFEVEAAVRGLLDHE
jgi:cation transport regulator ChaC